MNICYFQRKCKDFYVFPLIIGTFFLYLQRILSERGIRAICVIRGWKERFMSWIRALNSRHEFFPLATQISYSNREGTEAWWQWRMKNEEWRVRNGLLTMLWFLLKSFTVSNGLSHKSVSYHDLHFQQRMAATLLLPPSPPCDRVTLLNRSL